jgi:hypothetical protein
LSLIVARFPVAGDAAPLSAPVQMSKKGLPTSTRHVGTREAGAAHVGDFDAGLAATLPKPLNRKLFQRCCTARRALLDSAFIFKYIL